MRALLLDDGPRGDLRLRPFWFVDRCWRPWLARYSGSLTHTDLESCLRHCPAGGFEPYDAHARFLEFRSAAARAASLQALKRPRRGGAPSPRPSSTKRGRSSSSSAGPPPEPPKPRQPASSPAAPEPESHRRLAESMQRQTRVAVQARAAGAATRKAVTNSGLSLNRPAE